MKPVEVTDLEVLLERNSILILDVTNWAVGFVRQIISHKPSNISTKAGKKTLPTEIWLQILSFAEKKKRKHVYKAVYATKMGTTQVDGSESEPALVCNVLEEWLSCGDIRDATTKFHYQQCLNNPSYDPIKDDRSFNPEEEKFVRPFEISKAPTEETFSIPISHLSSEDKFLFHKIRVAEMIAWIERGKCNLCTGSRDHCCGCADGREVMEDFTSASTAHVDCGTRMLCPLCVGQNAAEYSAYTTGRGYDRMSEEDWEEYYEWVESEYKALGYME